MEILPMISLLAEVLVIALAIAIAVTKKKSYGWIFAAAYTLFLVYDATRLLSISLGETLGEFILLIGALLSLVAVWQIYQKK